MQALLKLTTDPNHYDELLRQIYLTQGWLRGNVTKKQNKQP